MRANTENILAFIASLLSFLSDVKELHLTIGASAAARSERSEAERCRLNAQVSRPAGPDSRPQRPESGFAARRPFSGPERSFFGPANMGLG
jgi:hypothetical protein